MLRKPQHPWQKTMLPELSSEQKREVNREVRREKIERVKEFIAPKRIYGKARGKQIIRSSKRTGRRAGRSAVSVFRQIAPARRTKKPNGTRSATDFVFG